MVRHTAIRTPFGGVSNLRIWIRRQSFAATGPQRHLTKLRYDASASICSGGNLLAILGIGGGAAA
jgi:hypothetical protein